MEIWGKRAGQSFVPASAADAIAMERLPEGKRLRAKIVQDRSPPQHRMAWALFTLVAQALNDGPSGKDDWTPEEVCEMAKVVTGKTRKWHVQGRVVEATASISYAAMDGREFTDFVNRFMDYVADEAMAPWIRDAPQWPEISAILFGEY